MPKETREERLIRQFWENHHLEQLKRFRDVLNMQGISSDFLNTEIAELEELTCVG